MKQRSVILALLVCLTLAWPISTFALPTRPGAQQTVSNLSSLDGGVQGFLERHGSALASTKIDDTTAAQVIEHVAWYYNVEVRVVLAMLETTSGLISAPAIDPAMLEQPFGTGPRGFRQQIEWAVRELKAAFGPYDTDLELVFTDGQSSTVARSEDVHSLAVKRFLANGHTLPEWEALVNRYGTVYTELFRDEPMAQISTPPASTGFLSTPWLPGTRVIHSSYFDHVYPMVDDGGDGNDIMVNYAGQTGLSYNGHDGHDYYFPDQPYGTPIVAAAAGMAYARTTRGLGVVIQHAGAAAGYESVYWHLEGFAPAFEDIIDGGGRWVERGELLGWSGATGFTDGAPHLHFEIRHNGKQVDPYGWSGTGSDPCAQFRRCEASVWLWDSSVPWAEPAERVAQDRTPPQALLTLNPPHDVLLALQFTHGALPAVGPLPASSDLRFAEGRWGGGAVIGPDAALAFPISPTLQLAQGTFGAWVDVPERWDASGTGRHYVVAASAHPADPAGIYSGTLALRHEVRGPGDQPVWTFWTVSDTGVDQRVSVVDALAPGWHHFALSWDQARGHKALYIDGALVGSAQQAPLPTGLGDTLELGRWSYSAGELDTALDEVVLYDHELMVREVGDLAARTTAPSYSATSTVDGQIEILTPAADDNGGIVQVQLGLDGVFAAPLPYYRSYHWRLPATPGEHEIAARLMDRAGNISLITQTLSVDRLPQAQAVLESWSPFTATLTISATADHLPLEMALSQSPVPVFKNWEPLTMSRLWHWLPMQPRRIYIWVRDEHGNEQGPLLVGPDLWRMYLPAIPDR